MSFFSPKPQALHATDARLHPYLCARTDKEASRCMEAVLAKIRPVSSAILKRHFFTPHNEGSRAQDEEDYEDVCLCVEVALHQRLTRMRAEYRTRNVIAKPIGDIEAYAAVVTYNAWKALLRAKKPVFHKVRRYIRALLDGHRSQDASRQMAVWEQKADSGHSQWVGGFARWRDANSPAVCSDGLTDLLQDPKTLMPEALASARKRFQIDVSDPLSHNGLMAIFLWLDHPVTCNHLASVLGAATDRTDAPHVSLDISADIADDSNQFERIFLSAYLRFFWQCACAKLPPDQCAALLLGARDPNGSSLIRELDQQGIAGLRACASVMGLRAETLAGSWDALPLEDKHIAEMLKIKVQGVRDRRLAARNKLDKRFEETLE